MDNFLTGIKLRIPDNADRGWITDTLDRLSSAGFNLVIPETFYHGYTIYPSNTAKIAGLALQRPSFLHWNPLDVFIQESHKRDMQVYAWVETFYVGNDQIEGPGPILSHRPEWAIRRADGSTKCGKEEWGHHFICPANPDAQQYIADIYSEILTEYAPDGIFIDYLRYPLGSLLDNPFCYCDYCRSTVKSELGLDLMSIPIDPIDPDFIKWTEWRQKQTEKAMRFFFNRIKSDVPTIKVIANVYGGYSPDLMDRDTLRDWISWCNEGILDIISTQNYGDDELIIDQIASDLTFIPPQVPFFPAISVEDIDHGNRQLGFIRSTRAIGAAYFVLSQLTEERIKALTNIKNQAVTQ